MRQLLLFIMLSFLLMDCTHISKEAKLRQVNDLGEAAKSLMASARYREALGELLKAESLDGNSKETHFLLANVYFFGFRRYEEATTHIKKAIKIAGKNYSEAENLYGVILLDQDKFEEAIVYFDRATKNLLYMTPYFAEQNWGDALTRLGKYDLAIVHLRQAIRMQPNLCGAYLPLAKNLRHLKKYSEAEQSLNDFVKNCDTEEMQKFISSSMLAEAYYELGLVKLDLKNMRGARNIFKLCAERFSETDIANKCTSKSN